MFILHMNNPYLKNNFCFLALSCVTLRYWHYVTAMMPLLMLRYRRYVTDFMYWPYVTDVTLQYWGYITVRTITNRCEHFLFFTSSNVCLLNCCGSLTSYCFDCIRIRNWPEKHRIEISVKKYFTLGNLLHSVIKITKK